MLNNTISHERLLEVIKYNKETGEFIWVLPTARWMKTGDIAGRTDKDGYTIIQIDNIAYRAGRLAWFYITKKWPSSCIDHIDRNTSNDKFNNLRLATYSENNINRRGIKGVRLSKNKKRFCSRIGLGKATIWLGTFDTEELAHAAYRKAAQKIFGEFGKEST